MRLISQDGRMNINYDLVHLSVDEFNGIWLINAWDKLGGKPLCLATYSTKEEALREFELIMARSNGNGKNFIL